MNKMEVRELKEVWETLFILREYLIKHMSSKSKTESITLNEVEAVLRKLIPLQEVNHPSIDP